MKQFLQDTIKRHALITLCALLGLLGYIHIGQPYVYALDACGTRVVGVQSNCSAICYNACKTQINPDTGQFKADCTGDISTWRNCCYPSGMDNTELYDPINQRCSCDDVLDGDTSNDPYVDNVACTSVPGQPGKIFSIPPYIYCDEGFSGLCCETQAMCQSNLVGTPTPVVPPNNTESASVFDYFRKLPIMQVLLPADDGAIDAGGSAPQEPGATISVGSVTPVVTITLGPTIAAPGNPAYAQDIVNEVKAVHGATFNCSAAPSMQCISVNRNNVNGITSQMTRVSATFKQNVNWSATTYNNLQCVGAAFALSRELNGVVPAVGHTAACEFVDTTTVHQYYPYGSANFSPQAGDLVIWNSSNGNCNPDTGHYGHIAYVSGVLGSTLIQIAEGDWAHPGDFRVRTVDVNLSGKTPKGFLRKL